MAIIMDKSEPAIVRAIKTVGVGKKGSRSLDKELVNELLKEFCADAVSPIAKGAFFGALVIKGLSDEEEVLEDFLGKDIFQNPSMLVEKLGSDAPEDIKSLCALLAAHKTLMVEQAERLGQFLVSGEPGESLRGFAVSILRVRYETADEYEGLLSALQHSVVPAFQEPLPQGEPVIQIAEPFDGVDHSYMITPLIAQFLQKCGYRALTLTGRNGGPKLVLNLADIAEELNAVHAYATRDFGNPKPELGWFIHQKDLSPRVDYWVERRRAIVKRPLFATLEKFLKPCSADILITSAFHLPYGEKMMTIAERAGFPASVVIRNGIEGTIAFPLKRSVKILCSVRQSDGSYLRHEIDFDVVKFLGEDVEVEEKMSFPKREENVRLIKDYLNEGRTDNHRFDLRVRATCAGLSQAIDWIKSNSNSKEQA